MNDSIDLIVSEMLRMCLDCSVVVALMNLHSCLRLVLFVTLSIVSLLDTAVAISVEIFLVCL